MTANFKHTLLAAVLIIGLMACQSNATSIVIADHSGALDPTTQDVTIWTKYLGYKVTATPDVTPPGSITVNDQRTDNNGNFTYNPTAGEIADIADGWKLSANVRVNNDNDTIGDYGITVAFDNVSTNQSLALEFGSSNGNVRIGAQLASNQWNYTTLAYTTLFDFVFFEAVYNASTGTLKYYADGVEVLADKSIGFRGVNPNLTDSRIIWGSLSTTGTGSGSYNLVKLETIPEPATVMLVMLGGGIFMARRRKACNN